MTGKNTINFFLVSNRFFIVPNSKSYLITVFSAHLKAQSALPSLHIPTHTRALFPCRILRVIIVYGTQWIFLLRTNKIVVNNATVCLY